MQELQCLGKNCEFRSVSAEENKQQYIREAFINGLKSTYIRQRLLERNTLTLDEAFNQARALEQAQKHSAAYENNVVASISEVTHDDDENLAAVHSKQKSSFKKKFNQNQGNCWFCGGQRHPRSKCPAREEECSKCKKIGHLGTVCRSAPQEVSAAIGSSPNLA